MRHREVYVRPADSGYRGDCMLVPVSVSPAVVQARLPAGFVVVVGYQLTPEELELRLRLGAVPEVWRGGFLGGLGAGLGRLGVLAQV